MIFEETSTDTINLINEISEKYNTIQKFITLKEKDYCLLLDEIEKKYDNPIVLTFCTIIDYV
ncbi:MAG: hypothetical protein LBC61_06800 [Candidatus Peribacteria bacterium]|jgi:hypothetical protein|nr:hypothetical protein [Candidatus Peribacteria bacterium]